MQSERFRPNLVLEGLSTHEEDLTDRFEFDTADGPVVLRLVKPCARCSIPDVDPQRGESTMRWAPSLAAYRADPRLNGQITFGMNAIVEQGSPWLRAGATGRATVRFD